MTFRLAIYHSLAVILFFFISSECFAKFYPETEADFALLPAYCKARSSSGNAPEAEIQKWKKLLGPGFIHVHHFCYGLHQLNIINRGVPTASQFNTVLQEFNYTQKHAGKDFPLQPKISLEKGKILLQLDRSSEAISEFNTAIKLKPTYTAPYAALSDYFIKVGLKDNAKAILEEGLRHSPNSKKLKRRLAELQ